MVSEAAQQRVDFIDQNFNEITPESDLGQMSFVEQATYFGYPVMKTHVVTEDGYILELHRIPGRQNETLDQALDLTRQD